MQSQTKMKLGATAGLRLLPGGKADSILAAVKKYLKASPFQLEDKTGVTVLDGELLHTFTSLHLCPGSGPADSKGKKHPGSCQGTPLGIGFRLEDKNGRHCARR